MSGSIYSSQALLNSVFGKASAFGTLSAAPVMSVAFSTTDPEGTSGLSEPASASYSRVLTSSDDWASATSADPSVIQNVNQFQFPQATESWGEIGWVALVDANDNVIISVHLIDPSTGSDITKTPTAGDTPVVAAGSLQFTMT